MEILGKYLLSFLKSNTARQGPELSLVVPGLNGQTEGP